MRSPSITERLPVLLSVSVNAALHSLSWAAKLAAPPAEESYGSAWASIAGKARPRLQAVIEQLRTASDLTTESATITLRESFQRVDRALTTLAIGAPSASV